MEELGEGQFEVGCLFGLLGQSRYLSKQLYLLIQKSEKKFPLESKPAIHQPCKQLRSGEGGKAQRMNLLFV